MLDPTDFLNTLNIRRSELDDTDSIEAYLTSSESRSAFARFFGEEVNILRLIETSYLSVTALDSQDQIIAFAAFDDSPPGLLSNDSLHENLWEKWFTLARAVDDELSSHNSLWLKFFIIPGVPDNLKSAVFERLLQSAYCSLPNTKGVLLLARGETVPEDYQAVGFNGIRDKFQELELYRREVLSDVRGVHFNSYIYYSDRPHVIPAIEIRAARQEDHDNLAEIFNAQSDVVTETYGDYFIAELIAAQDETSRCLVAQVHDKAVGLLSVRSDIDTQILWQCFELDPYDNLLDPDYMDIIREKREEIREKRRLEAEERARQEARRLKEETMICNIVAQRISLQEYLLNQQEEIFNEIDEIMSNPERYAQMNMDKVGKMIEEWLKHFIIQQPSDYFLDHPSDDPHLYCNILTEPEFFLDCLQFFGLPDNYMNGEGHYVDWYRRKEEEEKAARARKGAILGSKFRGKRDARRGDKKTQEEWKAPDPPEHFDLEPLKKALRSFLDATSDVRTRLRQELKKSVPKLEFCFKSDDGTVDPNLFHINTTNLAFHLEKGGILFDPNVASLLGPLLRCFGLLRTKDKIVVTQPPAPAEEEKKGAKPRGARTRAAQDKEPKMQMSKEIESGVIVEFQKDKDGNLLPAVSILMKTSLGEMLRSLDIIEDFDKTLFQLSMVSGHELNRELETLEKENQDKEENMSSSSSFREDRKNSTASLRDQSLISAQSKRSGAGELVLENQLDDKTMLYLNAVAHLDDLETIPEPPEEAKNSFGLVLYCMDEAFESFGIEFLETAFAQFPEREYMIITQPHTVQENSLMKFFTQVPKKPNNTFSHVLYIMHRDALLYKDIRVRRSVIKDLESIDFLLATSDESDKIIEKAQHSIYNTDSPYVSFTVRCNDDIIGLFVLSKDVNLKYYKSHFHIEEYILISEHKREGHTRLYHALLNPIFLKCQSLILKDILRLMDKTCLYFEINDFTVIPDVFKELLYVRSRRFPHFLVKKWDHERHITHETDGIKIQDGAERDYLDEDESEFALCFISKKLLSEPKTTINNRIVVVGASDTGLSFIETLLSNRYLNFTNIYLLAPGGISYYHIQSDRENLKSASTSYTLREMTRLLLESRVTVIDGRVVEIDRDEKRVILHDDSMLKYDTLILAMGLQDCTLLRMGYVSKGIAPVPENKLYVEGLISIDDPYLYQHFRPDGNIMAILNHRKQPGTTVVYGYTLHGYAFIQGLLRRGINPIRIKLAIPEPYFEFDEGVDPLFGGDENVLANQPAFGEDELVQSKILNELQELGIQVFKNAKLIAINSDDKNNLQSIRLSIGSEERLVQCRVLVTAGQSDVDDDIFHAVHDNGLVFNGRIIVNNKFQTTDPSIYAAGSLCEFSQQFRQLSPGRCMRLDRYNGRELGLSLAQSILSSLEIDALQGFFTTDRDEIPYFYLPKGKGGILPNDYYYYHIVSPTYAAPKALREKKKNRPDVVSDTISKDASGKVTGHLLRFTFNSYGIIESVTYLSKEPVVVQSLRSFVGLSETYLNKLTTRMKAGVIPDIAEFLSENWAMALYHDWFAEFCLNLKNAVKANISGVLEEVQKLTEEGKSLTRNKIEALKKKIPVQVKKMIQEDTLKYIRAHINHLPMYYIPGVEFE